MLSGLSKHQQFHYIVGINQLYPNTLDKIQFKVWYIGKSAILNYANRIHDTLNPTILTYSLTYCMITSLMFNTMKIPYLVLVRPCHPQQGTSHHT